MRITKSSTCYRCAVQHCFHSVSFYPNTLLVFGCQPQTFCCYCCCCYFYSILTTLIKLASRLYLGVISLLEHNEDYVVTFPSTYCRYVESGFLFCRFCIPNGTFLVRFGGLSGWSSRGGYFNRALPNQNTHCETKRA